MSEGERIFPFLCRHAERALQVALSLSVCFARKNMVIPYRPTACSHKEVTPWPFGPKTWQPEAERGCTYPVPVYSLYGASHLDG